MDVVEYKCPNCGAPLAFSPQAQRLSCEYCGGSFTIQQMKPHYTTLDDAAAGEEAPASQSSAAEEEFAENTKLYTCTSCGAEIMADTNQTSLFCCYCHSPVVLSGKMTGKFRPQKIIGFKISREQAVEKFKEWCFKPFVPKDFKSDQQLEKITGLYVPFWLADCDVDAQFSAIGKKIRRWSSGNYDYTETKEYAVERRASIQASKIPADGSKNIDDDLMEAIEPFEYGALEDFSMSYLSGFYADKYDMDKDAMFPRIQNRLNEACKKLIRDSIGSYTSLSVNEEKYNVLKSDIRYALLPVWFMAYKYKGKLYEFVLNGQTGKIAGTPPLAEKRLSWCCRGLWAACSAAFFAVIAFIIKGGMF